jgi:putative membrane protein
VVNALSQEQRDKVSAAVADAERNTSGEIIPVVVARAGAYPEAALLLTLAVTVLLVTVSWAVFQRASLIDQGWDDAVRIHYNLAWIVATIVLAFLASFLLVRYEPRALLPLLQEKHKQEAADRAAAEAFYRFRLTRTRARTAVLICVCLFERRVVVLGDEAINERLEQEDWDNVRDGVLQGIADNDLVEGLLNAVARAGELLARNFPADIDNPDEVTNELRVLD